MSGADAFINRHKRRMAAEQSGGAAAARVNPATAPVRHAPVIPATSTDNLMNAALEADLQRLSAIQSRSQKTTLKQTELLPRYREYLGNLITENQPRNPALIFRNMIWAFDGGDADWGLALGRFAIAHNIPTPEGFRRDIKNAFVGDAASLALDQQKTGAPDQAPFILDVLALSTGWDLVDEIRADLYKASAYVYSQLEGRSNTQEALDLYNDAQKLNARVRVTRIIKTLEKRLEAFDVEPNA